MPLSLAFTAHCSVVSCFIFNQKYISLIAGNFPPPPPLLPSPTTTSPISVPVIETVYVENVRPDEANIQLLSISGNTEHFHCSFFEEKLIAGGTNTSFQVVFLARQEGLVNNTLYIHSSVGSFMYRVSAVGEASPFRVRPLIGARVPLNASFASLIYIYNPFSTPLQVCIQ